MILTKNKDLFNKILDDHKNFKSSDFKIVLKIILSVCFISFSTNNFIFKYFTSTVVRFGYLNKIKSLIILAKMILTLFFKKNCKIITKGKFPTLNLHKS